MKDTILQSILEDSLDRMFVSDKHGRRMFFPLDDKKPGYLIESKSLEVKIRKFYTSSFFAGAALCVLGTAIFRNFFGFFGSFVVCFGGLYFVQQLYIARILKSSPRANVKYKDVVLEKYESDDAEDSSESDFQVP